MILKPSSTPSSPQPTKSSLKPPALSRVRRCALMLPVQKSNGSVTNPSLARRSIRASKCRDSPLPLNASNWAPISTDGSGALRWKSAWVSNASRWTVMSSSTSQQISPWANAMSALRAADRPRFGCHRHRNGNANRACSSASRDPSVDPSRRTTTSTSALRPIASSRLPSSRSNGARRWYDGPMTDIASPFPPGSAASGAKLAVEKTRGGGPTARQSRNARRSDRPEIATISVVAFRALMRSELARGGEVSRTVRAVDTATDPEYQGRGLFRALTRSAPTSMASSSRCLAGRRPDSHLARRLRRRLPPLANWSLGLGDVELFSDPFDWSRHAVVCPVSAGRDRVQPERAGVRPEYSEPSVVPFPEG
jgi:hypothetical protein